MKNSPLRSLFISVAVVMFFLSSPSMVFAATNASITPASGSYSANFTVTVNINTNGDSNSTDSIRVGYTGPVSYVSGTGGTVTACTPVFATGTGYVDISCIFPAGSPYTGSGTIAVLTFHPTAAGTAVFSLTLPDFGGGTTGTLTGSTYTIQTAGTGGALPQTAIFDGSVAYIVGSILLILSLFGFVGVKIVIGKSKPEDKIIPTVFRL